MNEPWFSPAQLFASLGMTLPLFFYYGWRIYSQIIDHVKGVRKLIDEEYLAAMVRANQLAEQPDKTTTDLTIAAIGSEFDSKIGCHRRALKIEAHSAILVGFLGTLVGVSGAFAALTMKTRGTDPLAMMEGLIKGGLATALVSSLVAAVLGVIVYTFLSLTEEKVTRVRQSLLRAMHWELCKKLTGGDNA
ncbi:MAG: MotA/TolQ/ExbB proton channel family protein [Sedimenticola sp.]